MLSDLSLGRLDFDLLHQNGVRFHHHNDRHVGRLSNTADESRMIVHLCPLHQWLTARARLGSIRAAACTRVMHAI